MLVAHISDPHVMEPSDPMATFVDTAARLAATVEALAELPAPPDVTIITGDLVNRGSAAEYSLLRSVLEPLPGRLLVVPGNHDDPGELVPAFGDHLDLKGTGDHLSYVVEDEELRMVGLDTTVRGRDDGELDPGRLAWLEAALGDGDGRPMLLFMHHPPFSAGMWWMDYGGLKGSDEVKGLVGRHPEVLRVLCGHVHRTTSVTWGSTVLSSAPSSFYATSAPTGAVEVPEVIDVAGAIPLLRWDPATSELVATELDPPGDHRRIPMPEVIGDRWSDYEARARSGAEMPAHR